MAQQQTGEFLTSDELIPLLGRLFIKTKVVRLNISSLTSSPYCTT